MRLHSNHLRQEGLPHPRPGFHHLRRRHRAGRGVWKATLLEAWKRDWSRAKKKVVIGDGAEWIWNLAEPYFPGAIQIVDLFHARQHLWELARTLHPNDEANQKAWIKVHQRRLLDKGKIE